MMTNSPSLSSNNLGEWLTRAVMILLFTATVILFIGQYTNLDLDLANVYYDASTRSFPWDQTWFGRDLMHGYVKNVILWFGYLILAFTLIDLVIQISGVFQFSWLSVPQRARLRVVALASILEPLFIVTLKHQSNMHCPWGVDQFGGSHPFLRLLDAVPDGWQAGHCFPAGHASSAMWLSVLAVLWLPHNPKRAFFVFLGGLAVGGTLGWVQQMRGQHFFTHTLGTAWISSAIIIALIALFSRQLCASTETPQKNILGYA